MKYYQLGEDVVFIPEELCLQHRFADGSAASFSLNAPSAKCLELLIQSRELVTHNALYCYAWGEHSSEVSPNVLYQNISLLRKTLVAAFGKNDEYIITVPRKGFYFNESINVREYDDVIDPDIGENVEQKGDCHEEKLVSTSVAQPLACIKYHFVFNHFLGKHYLLICGLVIFSFLLYYALSLFTYTSSVFDDYTQVANIDGCEFYASSLFTNKDKIAMILHKSEWVCIRGNYNYISGFNYSPSYTIISCPERSAIGVYPQCSTLYFSDESAQ